MKAGKTAGADRLANGIWRYGGKEIKEWAYRFCNEVWKEEDWPEEWKEEIVVIVKRDEREMVGKYKKITLILSLYKIYATVLGQRLRKEVEEKKVIVHNQTGFKERDWNS